jgi:hypothetical protein
MVHRNRAGIAVGVGVLQRLAPEEQGSGGEAEAKAGA